MRILIIEDEMPNARRLSRLLVGICPDWHIDGPLTSVAQMRAYFDGTAVPDLVFADIRLADGQVFDALGLVPPASQIIFTTAYSDHALRAFDYNTAHYLLKPIDPDDLQRAIDKALASRRPDIVAQPMRKTFLVRMRDELRPIAVGDVAFVRRATAGVTVVTFGGTTHNVETSMDACQMQLDPAIFFRASRRYLVNVNAIDRLTDSWNGKMRLHIHNHPDEEITVSRDRVRPLRRWLELS